MQEDGGDWTFDTFKSYYNDIKDYWQFLDGDILPQRIRSASTIRELSYNKSIRTHQGRRCLTKNNLQLTKMAVKQKNYQRQKNVNRWYASSQQDHFLKYQIKKQRVYPELKREIHTVSMDCPSIKKIGTRESNEGGWQPRSLVTTNEVKNGKVN